MQQRTSTPLPLYRIAELLYGSEAYRSTCLDGLVSPFPHPPSAMSILYALAHPLPSSETSVLLLNNTFASADGIPTAGCGDIRSCRTAEEIIYSCLAVIFACTWVAIHPNIPRKFSGILSDSYETGDSFTVHSAVVTLRNVLVMILALIAPELIILWAIRQWFAARQIAKDYESELTVHRL
jgi:hypothetical protein